MFLSLFISLLDSPEALEKKSGGGGRLAVSQQVSLWDVINSLGLAPPPQGFWLPTGLPVRGGGLRTSQGGEGWGVCVYVCVFMCVCMCPIFLVGRAGEGRRTHVGR